MNKNLLMASLWILASHTSLLSQPQQETLSTQESFFLHRMSEFWKDKDFSLIKKQTEEFLQNNPYSSIRHHLYAILGDLYYEEENFKKAIEYYSSINDRALKEQTALRYCQCLYLLKHYSGIISLIHQIYPEGLEGYKDQYEIILIHSLSLYKEIENLEDNDQKQERAEQAKNLFSSLLTTSFRDKALIYLSEIHQFLGENTQAYSLLILLADEYPEKKEEILFKAAALQAKINLEEALQIYQQIVNLGKSKASEAAFYECLLLFQGNRIEELISRFPVLEKRLPIEKKHELYFFLGYRYFKNQQYLNAIDPLKKFLSQEKDNSSYKNIALVALLSCAEEIKNEELFDTLFEELIISYPNDANTITLLLIHAQNFLKAGEDKKAENTLSRLLLFSSDFPEKENTLYVYANLLKKNEQWERSRIVFLSLLSQFPKTQYPSIPTSIIQCAIQEVNQTNSQEVSEKKEQLIQLLEQFSTISYSQGLDIENNDFYLLLLSQLLAERQEYQKAQPYIEAFSKNYPHHRLKSEGSFIQFQIYQGANAPIQCMLESASEALCWNQAPPQSTILRLYLFNAYLDLKDEAKAADFLYQIDQEGYFQVQKNNQLWLAQYYYDQIKQGNLAYENRVQTLFHKILQLNDSYILKLNPRDNKIEEIVLKYSQLLSLDPKKELLSSLVEFYYSEEEYPWVYKEKALFELGKTHASLKEVSQALILFDNLISLKDPYYAQAALLEKCRLQFSQCSSDDMNENNSMIQNILTDLKDLQIHKQLSFEPLYLEAALDYVDMRTFIMPQETQLETKLFFLKRVQEEFNNTENPIQLAYHESRLINIEKDKVFQTYMKFIEAEIWMLQSEIAQAKSSLQKAEDCSGLAAPLFKELLEDENLTPYLKNRAQLHLFPLRHL